MSNIYAILDESKSTEGIEFTSQAADSFKPGNTQTVKDSLKLGKITGRNSTRIREVDDPSVEFQAKR